MPAGRCSAEPRTGGVCIPTKAHSDCHDLGHLAARGVGHNGVVVDNSSPKRNDCRGAPHRVFVTRQGTLTRHWSQPLLDAFEWLLTVDSVLVIATGIQQFRRYRRQRLGFLHKTSSPRSPARPPSKDHHGPRAAARWHVDRTA